jgi:transglutaminase-like putative cysteine protease
MTIKTFSTLAFAFCILTFGKAESVSPPREIGMQAQYPIDAIPENLKKDAAAVIRTEEQFFEVETAAKATHRYKIAVSILKKDHSWGDFTVHYNKWSTVTNIRARFYDATGKLIRKLEKEEINDRASHDGVSLYSDSRFKHIENLYGVLPYTFELEYEVKFTGLQGYPDWDVQPHYATAIQHSEYTLTTPLSIKPLFKPLNTHIKPVETTKSKEQILKWIADDIAAVKSEPLSPPASKILPWVSISPSAFELDGKQGRMTDWMIFGKFIYDLNKDRDKVSPELAAKIKSMADSVKTNAEKISVLYHYLQKNMRYISIQLGIGGWQTFEASYVEKNKYGDCKALSNFMKAMLKVIGIESQLAIVRAGDNRESSPTEDFCSPAFNHMILFIPSENQWLECTSQEAPTGYLSNFTEGRRVLLITPEGGKMVKTPTNTLDKNTQVSKTSIVLTETGSATLKNGILLRGSLHDSWRQTTAQISKEEFQKQFVNILKLPTYTVTALDAKPNADKPELTLDYELAIEKYAAKAGTRLFVPMNLHNPFDDTPSPTEKRLLPVEIGGDGYAENDEVMFSLPENYEIESIPTKEFDIQSEFGSYKVSIVKSGENKLLYKRQLEIRPVHIPAERFNELRDFYKKMQQADATKVVLKKKVG